MTVNIHEFAAAEDLLTDTIEESERLGPDDAIDVRAAIERLKRRCSEAIAALDMGLVRTLEHGTVIRDGQQYEVVPNGKWSWEHDRIARRAAELAALPDEETGEVPTAHRAAAEAARMVRQIYASDSTPAKKGKLEQFGIDVDDVRDWVGADGRKVKVTPATTPETPRRKS